MSFVNIETAMAKSKPKSDIIATEVMDVDSDTDIQMDTTASSMEIGENLPASNKSQTSSTAKVPLTSTNRRKSNHHRLILDDSISFESVLMPKEAAPSPESHEESMSSAESDIEEIVLNPNESLMRKVAFLRVCVNYMMLNLNKTPFDFDTPMTLSVLMEKYKNKKHKRSH